VSVHKITMHQPFSKERRSFGPRSRLYFGNIPFSMNEDGMRHVFRGCGEIIHLQIIRDEEGRSQGYGFLTLTCDGLERALRLNAMRIQNREMKVNYARTRFMPEQELSIKRIFISHVPHHVTERDIMQLFSSCPGLESCFFIYNREESADNRRVHRGFGFVDFGSEAGVLEALKYNGVCPFPGSDRALVVEVAKKHAKPSRDKKHLHKHKKKVSSLQPPMYVEPQQVYVSAPPPQNQMQSIASQMMQQFGPALLPSMQRIAPHMVQLMPQAQAPYLPQIPMQISQIPMQQIPKPQILPRNAVLYEPVLQNARPMLFYNP